MHFCKPAFPIMQWEGLVISQSQTVDCPINCHNVTTVYKEEKI